MNFNFKKLPPFKWFVLQNFPFIEADFDAITYYQLLCKIVEYLNKVIDENNVIGEQTENLTNAFNELQDYVNHYFDNLDVQDEINNKLDEMAESGQLADIIAQYLQLAGVLAFDTLNDMKNATNLVNGSIAKTLGTNTYNDGYGYFYKIRNILNTDVVDNDNIVALTNFNNLVAEKIKKININNKFDVPTIMIGDSYAVGETAGGVVTGWCDRLKNLLNLSDENYYKIALSGYGFLGSENFLTGLQNYISNIQNPKTIKSIIVCGGYNDARNWTNGAELNNNIQSFVDYCKNIFPNAIIYIGMCGNTSIVSNDAFGYKDLLNNQILPIYQIGGDNKNSRYLSGVENILHFYNLLSADGIHPSDTGYMYLAQWIYKAYTTGYCETFSPYTDIVLTSNSNNPATIRNAKLQCAIHNDILSIKCKEDLIIEFNTIQEFNQRDLILANFSNDYLKPSDQIRIPVKYHTDDKNVTGQGAYFYGGMGLLKINGDYLSIDIQQISDTPHAGWLAGEAVKEIIIKPFNLDISLRCV